MKKINFNFLKSGVTPFIGLLIFGFILTSKVSAQDNLQAQVVGVRTVEYSVLSSSVYILAGEYYGNTAQRPFTTYFQYKRDNMNLNTGAEETIKIVRGKDSGASGVFYASPSLQLSSTYYFRAVGYFNDTPSQKFYGEIFSFRTGYPFPANIPFTLEFDKAGSADGSVVKPYNAPPCNPPCVIAKPSPTPTPTTPTSTPNSEPTPTSPSTPVTTSTAPLTSSATSSLTPTASKSVSDTRGSSSGGSSLVPCTEAKDCNFDKFMELINNVIRFILFKLVVPIAAIMFAYAGFLLITAGGEAAHARTKAKDIFTNAVIGLIIAVAAWLIVRTLLSILGYNGAWIFDKF